MNSNYQLNLEKHKSTEPARKKAVRIVLNILLVITVLLVVFTAVTAAFGGRDNAFLFGYKPFIIGGNSMEPAYKKYGVVLIKHGGYDEVGVGELIAYNAEQMGGQPAFHRVIEVTAEGFITKGDNNKVIDDQIVDRGAFIGREVWHTNVTAWLFTMLQTPEGLLVLIIMPTFLIIMTVIFVKMTKKALKKVETLE